MGFRGKAERLRRRGSIKGGALIGAIVLLSPSAIHSPARTSPESLPPTCNGTWTVVPSPNPTQQSALLQDVVAVSANGKPAVSLEDIRAVKALTGRFGASHLKNLIDVVC